MGSLFAILLAPLAVAQPAEFPATVRFTEARSKSISQRVELPGTLASARMSRVASEISGAVVEFPVREGDRVSEGQLLAKLRIEQRELQLRASQAGLEEDRTRLKLAELQFRRTRELFDKNVLSRQELDNAQYEYEALAKRIDRVEAEIARLRDDVARAEIRAPFAGVVVAEHTQVGEWLEEGGEVVELLAVDRLEVVVPVPERHFGNLNRRVSAQIRFGSLPDLRIEAPITTLVPQADPQARTFPVKIAIPKPDRRLGVGMVCQVTLALGTSYEATMIPKDALVREGPEEVVYVVTEDNRAGRVPVTSGAAVGQWIEVQGPVKPGQRVIARGNERLQPGQPLQAQPMEYPLP